MDFIDKIKGISVRVEKQKSLIATEEATKNAFIMPFISLLGYDVFNPFEVIPEFTADTGTKKGEKVDYAIKKDDKVVMLFECKKVSCDLTKEHKSQLYRYFSVTEARFAILTNGIIYQFFSDIDEPNKMDSKPFFEFNILEFEANELEELRKFTKSAFSLDEILTTASLLKYTNAIKKLLVKEIEDPSDAFVRLFASQIYDGRLTQAVIEDFSHIVKQGWEQFLADNINSRLKSALTLPEEPLSKKEDDSSDSEIDDNNLPEKNNGIVTTEEEIDAFNIVKAILRENVDVKRIAMRDTKSYCGILLDNNNRKPICRLHFNYSQKYLGILSNKKEERIPIETVDDIFTHANKVKAVISEYDL
jgi:hypothetical protein